MADFGLFIGFGAPVRGRERQAIQGFSEVFEYNSRLQQEGEIESFETVLLEPHGGNLAASSSSAETRTSWHAFAPAMSSSGISREACSRLSTSAWWARLSAGRSRP